MDCECVGVALAHAVKVADMNDVSVTDTVVVANNEADAKEVAL